MNKILILMVMTASLVAQTGFNGDRAFQYLEEQVAIGIRAPNTPGAQKAIDYYKTFLEPLADEVTLQNFQHPDPYADRTLNLTNIIARFDPENRNRVMLCAHWDTRPRADRDPLRPEDPILGANDGASGVAVLMEIANQLREQPARIGVDLVLFDGEDYGKEGHLEGYLIGSRYLAANLYTPPPQQVILLDMIGDSELEITIDPVSYRAAPHLVDAIWEVADELGYTEFVREMGPGMYDDHVSFIDIGIPAIDIIDFSYPNDYTNYWHTHEDTPDKCSPYSLEVVGNTILTWVYRQ